MSDPFATALGVLLQAAGSVAAVYTPSSGGAGSPIRVIHGQASSLGHLGFGAAVLDGDVFTIATADAPALARGDTLRVGLALYTISADPLLDEEGLSWKAQAQAD